MDRVDYFGAFGHRLCAIFGYVRDHPIATTAARDLREHSFFRGVPGNSLARIYSGETNLFRSSGQMPRERAVSMQNPQSRSALKQLISTSCIRHHSDSVVETPQTTISPDITLKPSDHDTRYLCIRNALTGARVGLAVAGLYPSKVSTIRWHEAEK
jgi:hypothetical protein